ncbi:hypothetical protein ACX4MZ_10630 [Roseomonas mucosa]
MADYFTLFSCHLPLGKAENIEPALAIYREMQDQKDQQRETLGFDADHHPDLSPDGVFLGTDGSGAPAHVIEFVLRCAEAFDLQGLWGFRWALTCSRDRLDGFGGGAHLLDLGRRATVGWLDTEHWLQSRIAAAPERLPTVSRAGHREGARR